MYRACLQCWWLKLIVALTCSSWYAASYCTCFLQRSLMPSLMEFQWRYFVPEQPRLTHRLSSSSTVVAGLCSVQVRFLPSCIFLQPCELIGWFKGAIIVGLKGLSWVRDFKMDILHDWTRVKQQLQIRVCFQMLCWFCIEFVKLGPSVTPCLGSNFDNWI